MRRNTFGQTIGANDSGDSRTMRVDGDAFLRRCIVVSSNSLLKIRMLPVDALVDNGNSNALALCYRMRACQSDFGQRVLQA